MHLPLKEYQERTLETLTEYYQTCLRPQNVNTAFYDLTQRPYVDLNGLRGMPYVCLRLPTGGGKTFVACHAVGITASELLKTENPLVLWLTPSNAIRDQTLKALKDTKYQRKSVQCPLYRIVEYKGDHLWSVDDAKEKGEIGELWEERSDRKCLFIMPKGPDLEAIRAKLSSTPN